MSTLVIPRKFGKSYTDTNIDAVRKASRTYRKSNDLI